jgi:exodeoxyribonuclease V alpha subunit
MGDAPRVVAVPPGLQVLAPFVEAGVFGTYEVQLAAALLRLNPGLSDHEVLALAVAARAPRFGHVCVAPEGIGEMTVGADDELQAVLPWPDADAWASALAGSPVVADPDSTGDGPLRPLVWDSERLYLHRYWHYELAVAEQLVARSSGLTGAGDHTGPDRTDRDPADPDPEHQNAGILSGVGSVLDALFGPSGAAGPDLQRLAARRGLRPGVSIIAGGPGTGKTYTVARMLAAAHLVATAQHGELQVALAAPTGKAAARMGEAVRSAVSVLEASGAVDAALATRLVLVDPTTIHSLLGRGEGTHFYHDRENPLPHDLVLVDETSMVSLPLMAALLDAVRPDARLVLVGDPFQLASIEAGTVMSDVVGPFGASGGPSGGAAALVEMDPSPLAGRITVLDRQRRFDDTSTISALADGIRSGDAGSVLELLGDGAADVDWVRPDDSDRLAEVVAMVVGDGVGMVSTAQQGDARAAVSASVRSKVLAATRLGPLGVADWTDRIERGVALQLDGYRPGRRWQAGRPVLVTANDRLNRVFNGDTGVAVQRDGRIEVAFPEGDGVRLLAPSRLDRVETWWAMTIHKSQGSEFAHVVVALPAAGSPILTRELLYTAVTRAKDRLTIVASEESVVSAVARPVARASGLRDRLWSI